MQNAIKKGNNIKNQIQVHLSNLVKSVLKLSQLKDQTTVGVNIFRYKNQRNAEIYLMKESNIIISISNAIQEEGAEN